MALTEERRPSTSTGSEKGSFVDAPSSLDGAAPDAPSEPVPGPQMTPFTAPAASVKVPEPAPLTMDQETAYNSLLNAVSEWCVLTTTRDGKQKTVTMVDEEYMWLTRDCLLRYLRASKWSVVTASQRLVDTLQWRRDYGLTKTSPTEPPKITPEYISPENETGKQWILGYDNEGRPCHYLNPSRQNTKRSERQIEHLVFMLERVVDLMPPGQESLALLMNFAETRSGQGASVGQGKQVLNILQSHYPERLGRALLCNLPWHIWGFMKIITPFIDPITRKKLVFDTPLENFVPAAQLTKSHGGTLDFEYEHATYWPALLKLADERRAAMVERWERGGKMVGEYERYLRGGTDRSLRDDRREHPNERGRGQLLGGTSLSRDGSKASTGTAGKSMRNRDRSVVVVHGDEEHPLRRTVTADELPTLPKGVPPSPPPKNTIAAHPNGVVESPTAISPSEENSLQSTPEKLKPVVPEKDRPTEVEPAQSIKSLNGSAGAPTATVTTIAH